MNDRREQLELLLSAYLDDELSPSQRAEVEALLAHNAEARALLAELREISEGLRSLPRAIAKPDFVENVQARMERHALLGPTPTQQHWTTRRLAIHRSRSRWAVAAVIVLMLGVSSYMVWFFKGRDVWSAANSQSMASREKSSAIARVDQPLTEPPVALLSPLSAAPPTEPLAAPLAVLSEMDGEKRDRTETRFQTIEDGREASVDDHVASDSGGSDFLFGALNETLALADKSQKPEFYERSETKSGIESEVNDGIAANRSAEDSILDTVGGGWGGLRPNMAAEPIARGTYFGASVDVDEYLSTTMPAAAAPTTTMSADVATTMPTTTSATMPASTTTQPAVTATQPSEEDYH